MNALVLGAGVIGLTSALALREKGFDVALWSKEFSPHTTSDVAAAFWYPYEVYPIEKVTAWAIQSYARFKILQQENSSGIRERKMIHYFPAEVVTPGWSGMAHNYFESSVDAVDGVQSAFSFDTFVIDMTLYMPFLVRKCNEAGVAFVHREVNDLGEIDSEFKLIVNCTGLGSKELCNDDELVPGKGQVVRIPGSPKAESILLCHTDLEKFSMIVPRTNDIVLGGTYQHTSDLSVDPAETQRIVADCKRMSPSVFANGEEQTIIASAVGLRPSRAAVRLEVQKCGEQRIIHNYGHGGAGVTLSWGCAESVAALANSN